MPDLIDYPNAVCIDWVDVGHRQINKTLNVTNP